MTPTAYIVSALRIPLGEPIEGRLPALLASRLGCGPDDLLDVSIYKRSLDARGRRHPQWDLEARVLLAGPLPSLPEGVRVWAPPVFEPLPEPDAKRLGETVAIIGTGPGGLFAALTLVERGLRPVLIDRGEPVERRAKDVSRLMGKGEIDPESNLCFGEGGAGTWSDGKLYTRIGNPDVDRVLHMMVSLGAPGDILVERRPHLGTDRLVSLLKGIRAHLERMGATFRFRTRVERIEPASGRGRLFLSDGTTLEADHVVLAAGHSARDLYRVLRAAGVAMEAKPFAVGLRVEHPQQLINEIQLGPCARTLEVPAAEYRVTYDTGAGPEGIQVHSFCMCPGGSVVPTATREGEVCVNGMSHAARSGHYANAAVVTVVHESEIPEAGDPILAGIALQEVLEGRAWELGGGAFRAPAARLVDYLAGRGSASVRRTTYRRGVAACDLEPLFEAGIHERLRAGIRHFERRMRGFVSEEAVLIGVETRTSSPLRIVRDRECRSISHGFLYPCGEGAGYAGGITSAAVDGVRVARAILAPAV